MGEPRSHIALGATFGAPAGDGSSSPDARIPGDLGFSSLGLLLSYAGGLFGCLWATATLALLFSGAAKGGTLPVLLIGLTGAIRSVWSMFVGARLTSGDTGAGGAVRRFVVAALAQSVFAAVTWWIAVPAPLATQIAIPLFLLLVSWPIALAAIIARPEARRLFATAESSFTRLRSGNLGVEGAGAMMVFLGAVGAVLAATLGYTLFTRLGKQAPGWFVAIAGVTLLAMLVRAVLHVRAGLVAFSVSSQTLGTSSERLARFAAAVRAYTVAAYVSIAVVLFGALALAAKASPVFFLFPFTLAGPLVAWPVIVTKLAERARLAVVDDESGDAGANEAPFTPAEDSGLSALGFVLLGTSALAVAGLIAGWVAPTPAGLGGLLSLASESSVPTWMKIGSIGVGLGAGVGLSLMTSWARVSALVYGLVGLASALWNMVELLGRLDRFRLGLDAGVGVTVAAGVLSLVMPILAIALALRNRARVG